jgi:hypothetical protein
MNGYPTPYQPPQSIFLPPPKSPIPCLQAILIVRSATPIAPSPGSLPALRAHYCAHGSVDSPLEVASAIPCSGPCTRPGRPRRYGTCSLGAVAAAVGSSSPALGWVLSGDRQSGAGVATGPCWRYSPGS